VERKTRPDGIARCSSGVVSDLCLLYCLSGGVVVQRAVTDLGHFTYSWVVLSHKALVRKHWVGEKLRFATALGGGGCFLGIFERRSFLLCIL